MSLVSDDKLNPYGYSVAYNNHSKIFTATPLYEVMVGVKNDGDGLSITSFVLNSEAHTGKPIEFENSKMLAAAVEANNRTRFAPEESYSVSDYFDASSIGEANISKVVKLIDSNTGRSTSALALATDKSFGVYSDTGASVTNHPKNEIDEANIDSTVEALAPLAESYCDLFGMPDVYSMCMVNSEIYQAGNKRLEARRMYLCAQEINHAMEEAGVVPAYSAKYMPGSASISFDCGPNNMYYVTYRPEQPDVKTISAIDNATGHVFTEDEIDRNFALQSGIASAIAPLAKVYEQRFGDIPRDVDPLIKHATRMAEESIDRQQLRSAQATNIADRISLPNGSSTQDFGL